MLKRTLFLAPITGFILLLGFLFILPLVFTKASGLIFTRAPSGNFIESPLTIRVQGIFGVDFCSNQSTYYIVQYFNTETSAQFGSGAFHHNQGEAVDDTFQININPGVYQQSRLFCDTPDGAYIVIYGVDSGGSLTIVSATPTPAPTPTPTPTPTSTPTPVPSSASSSNSGSSSSSNLNTGTINVVKTVVNDNGGAKLVSDFPLFVNGMRVVSGVTNYFPAPASIYTVTETSNAGYVRTFSSDCDSNGQLNLNGGDNKFCIVTNDDIAISNPLLPDTGIIMPPVPPLIEVVKVPSPLALPGGPGPVLYTYTLRNIGTVPVTNVTMVGDTCSPINLVSGDLNGDSILGLNETWVYTCQWYLPQTHTNTVVATGWANGISAIDIASSTVIVGVPKLPNTGITPAIVVPPLIHVIKIPSLLTLPAGGGIVTYTDKVTNPGKVALSNVSLADDKCSPVKYISGDTNFNSKLDMKETWTYTCLSRITRTTTNTVTARGDANNLTAKDLAIVTVVAANSSPISNEVRLSGAEIILWDLLILVIIIVILILLYEKKKKHRSFRIDK